MLLVDYKIVDILYVHAEINLSSKKFGTPLIQLITYFIEQHNDETSGLEHIVKKFIEKGAILTPVMERPPGSYMSVLDAVIRVNNSIKSAKLIVKEGLHPIHGGHGPRIPVLCEYFKFGSNNFLTWLVNLPFRNEAGLLADEIHQVAGVSLECPGIWKLVWRHPIHALLTTGNERFTRAIVDKLKSEHTTEEKIMCTTDRAERTALHIAAEGCNEDAVKNLLKM